MTDEVLRFVDTAKRYRLGETIINALRGIDLSVAAGEFVAISGPSGSGKSTLLHLGAGLDRPTSGSVQLLGNDIQSLSDARQARQRNRKVGFIFQGFHLIPVLTVRENVEYPGLLYGGNRTAVRTRAMELLSLAGIADQADKRPRMLSGGQRQRVAIARSLINQPAVVFADEPTANLDRSTGDGIMAMLRQLNRMLGTTVVFSTHDLRIMENADRIVQLEDGICIHDSAGIPA